jgi:hypothetical protein
MLNYCKMVWIPTRPELTILIESLGITSERVVVIPMVTKSMTETILKVAAISSADEFMLCMPDTYFEGELPYKNLGALSGDLKLACWEIRPEQKGKLGQILFQAGSKTPKLLILVTRIQTAPLTTHGEQCHLEGNCLNWAILKCHTPVT